MKIAICGSINFAKDIIKAEKQLNQLGHQVTVPANIYQYAEDEKKIENKWDKIELDLFKNYYNEIKKVDAILIMNIDKNNINNYIGGNSLIEMAFAHILNKNIYLLNPTPNMNYSDEIEAMNPIVINGDLNKIK